MSVLLVSIFLFLLISVGLSLVGFRFWVQPKAALERVMGEVGLAEQMVRDPSLSFRHLLTKIGNVVPANPTDVGILQRRLLSAGIRSQHGLKVLYGVKGCLAVVLTLSSIGLVFGFEMQSEMSVFQILAAGALGWLGPNVVLNRMATKRKKAIKKGLPNALDMLVICVESGLGLDQALMQVSKELQRAHPEITDELSVMNLELRAGKRRSEALHNFGQRTDVDEAKRMVSVLIQADRFGTSISQTLRNFSDFLMALRSMPLAEVVAIGFTGPLFITALSGPLLGEAVGVRALGRGRRRVRGRAYHGAARHRGLPPRSPLGPVRRVRRRARHAAHTTAGANRNQRRAGDLHRRDRRPSLPFAILAWQAPSIGDLGLFSLVGIAGGSAAYLQVIAYRNAPAAVVAPFYYSSLIWATAFGWMLWRESPEPAVWIGAAIVAGAGVYITRREIALERRA